MNFNVDKLWYILVYGKGFDFSSVRNCGWVGKVIWINNEVLYETLRFEGLGCWRNLYGKSHRYIPMYRHYPSVAIRTVINNFLFFLWFILCINIGNFCICYCFHPESRSWYIVAFLRNFSIVLCSQNTSLVRTGHNKRSNGGYRSQVTAVVTLRVNYLLWQISFLKIWLRKSLYNCHSYTDIKSNQYFTVFTSFS